MTDSLRPIEFEILLTLAGGVRHGYAIILDTEARARGTRVETATLYRALRRLVDAGLVSPAPAPSDEAELDPRRRYYAITDRGRNVARAEALRMNQLVDEARAASLLPRTERTLG